MARLGVALALVCMLAGAGMAVAGRPNRELLQTEDFCTLPDPEFKNYVVTTATALVTDAAALCASLGPGYSLAKVEANNLFRSDPTLPNPLNTYDGTGFPFLPELIASCNPVLPRPVSVLTLPGFATPGTCTGLTAAGKKFGAANGDLSNPLCTKLWQALCYKA